jgi:predicted nucleic acid-binding protein
VRWIIDTSAWSHRGRLEVIAQLRELLADDADELVLSPAVELEILREPQHAAVAERRRGLEEAMDVLEATPETFALAADAMERLATHAPNAHRRPVADLITAALAHQHGGGIIHLAGDFEAMAEHGGLSAPLFRIELDTGSGATAEAHPAHRQRQLRNELAGLVHQLPVSEAEEFLVQAVRQARERLASAGRP